MPNDAKRTADGLVQPDDELAGPAHHFAAHRRVRIVDVLPKDMANSLAADLTQRKDWLQVVNAGNVVYEIDRQTRADFPPHRRQALDDAIYLRARTDFQYRYESIRIPDEGREPDLCPVHAFAEWMSIGPGLTLAHRVTGDVRPNFADAQATRYAAGDFLTAHDDRVEGKGRLYAYVLGLTPVWRPEWGGLLLFHGPDGTVEGRSPGFNVLDLFEVPLTHSVSLVSPATDRARLSVTGWLRAVPA